MATTLIYTIVVRTQGEYELDDTRFYFSSLDAIARHFADVAFRMSDLYDAIEESKRTVEDVGRFLADQKNMNRELTLANGISIVTGVMAVYQ